MNSDLKKYRESNQEKERTKDLLELIPEKGAKVLDAGAREGFFSILLTDYFEEVTALDLVKPEINHKNVVTVNGDITNLNHKDNYFDLVLCSEVLEHIPTESLAKACSELSRVSKKNVLIGVPYKQDIRVGRTTCYSCGKKNPPYGHINSFDKVKLKNLFDQMKISNVSFVGKKKIKTNYFSVLLMDFAGNPYGTYNQEESCIYCQKKLVQPNSMKPVQKLASLASRSINLIQRQFIKSEAKWIHILFSKAI